MSLSTAEYAEQCGISEQRVRELARNRKIKAERRGRAWTILEDAGRRPSRRRPLSESSQQELIQFLNTFSIAHVSGNDRKRLAERLNKLKQAENPAELLREYFAGSPLPEGRGGAALVRAALSGKDEQVRQSLTITPRRALINSAAVASNLKTIRAIRGMTPEQAARLAKIDVTSYRQLESGRPIRNGNLNAARAFAALGHSPSYLSTGETSEKRQ